MDRDLRELRLAKAIIEKAIVEHDPDPRPAYYQCIFCGNVSDYNEVYHDHHCVVRLAQEVIEEHFESCPECSNIDDPDFHCTVCNGVGSILEDK